MYENKSLSVASVYVSYKASTGIAMNINIWRDQPRFLWSFILRAKLFVVFSSVSLFFFIFLEKQGWVTITFWKWIESNMSIRSWIRKILHTETHTRILNSILREQWKTIFSLGMVFVFYRLINFLSAKCADVIASSSEKFRADYSL